MHYFLQIYGTLPRAGPGSNELTRRALEMMSHLPRSPRILDVGCGPGMQTVELLQRTKATVVALDFLPEMIARVKAGAESAGVSDRLVPLVQDMKQMAFAASSFDVIWSEGAIYNMGFEAGLKKVKAFVKPGGWVAVSDAVWLKPDPPPEAVAFWRDYPEMDTVAAKLEVIRSLGYAVAGHFIFPPSAWTEPYYDPMDRRIEEKAQEWRGIPEAEAVVAAARNEISIFRRHGDCFGYAFFVMRNRATAPPPR